MTDPKTPPHGSPRPPPPPVATAPLEPPRPLPTLANVHALLSGVSGQVGGTRRDLDMVVDRIEALARAVEGLSAPPPSPSPSSPAEPTEDERPTLRVRAGRGGRWVLVAFGVVSLVGQVVALSRRPEYGPLVVALREIAAFLLDLARSLGGAP